MWLSYIDALASDIKTLNTDIKIVESARHKGIFYLSTIQVGRTVIITENMVCGRVRFLSGLMKKSEK